MKKKIAISSIISEKTTL